MNTEKLTYVGMRTSLEIRKLIESDAASMSLSVSEYIRYKLVTERTKSLSVEKNLHSEKVSLKSLEFLEENYKDLSRMIMATQIAVDTIASRFLKKETYISVQKLYNKAFALYDVTKDELKNKKPESEES